jgi:predicted dienelactone hydrolase
LTLLLALTIATPTVAKDDESDIFKLLLDAAKKAAPATPAQPAALPAKKVQIATIAGLSVAVWMPADTTPRPMPVIVFSHGFRGCDTQSSFLMRALADHGYLVVAPNHHDAFCSHFGRTLGPQERFGRPDAWTEHSFEDRRDDIAKLLDALEKDVPWSSLVDPQKIGLAGHSLGGYTVLGLSGGWPSWKRADVKAVLALSPWCEPYLRHGALDKLTVPVMYQGGSIDLNITPTVRRPGGAFDKTPAPAFFVELAHAGHLAWTDANPRFQDTIVHYALTFFDAELKAGPLAGLSERYGEVDDVKAKQAPSGAGKPQSTGSSELK